MDTDRPNEPLGNWDEETGGQSGGTESSVEAKVEREVVLRLIASRAAVDQDYLDMLRANPAEAVAALNVSLSEEDMRRFEGLDWDTIQGHVDALRQEVGIKPPGAQHMMRGAW